MKKVLLSAVLLACLAAAAEAQITVTYTRETSNSRLHVRFHGGSFHSYGYGGYGYGHGFGGGFYTDYGGYGYGTVTHAVAPGVVAGVYRPWGGYVYPPYARPILDYYPGPLRTERVPERSPENASAAFLDQARKRVKKADYAGAVEDAREAVLLEALGGVSEAWFAVALALKGDIPRADKALRAALARGFKGRLDLVARDKREEARILAALEGKEGPSTAYVLSLLGRGDKLAALAEKDAALKPLLQ